MSSSTSNELFPIRELSARTQVNTVTIRAWERRYGLLKPKRTEKGHRLYDEMDVKRVEDILALIARGVSVGKVKALLNQTSASPITDDKALWHNAITQIQLATQQRASVQLENLIADYFLNYPVSLCEQKLFEPIFTQRQKEKEQSQWQDAFLESELLAYTLRRLKNAQKESKGNAPTELILTYGQNTRIWPLLFLSLKLADAQVRLQLINQPIALSSFIELSQAAEGEKEQASPTYLFYQDGVWQKDQVSLAKKALKASQSRVICGTAAIISQIEAEKQVYAELTKFAEQHFDSIPS